MKKMKNPLTGMVRVLALASSVCLALSPAFAQETAPSYEGISSLNSAEEAAGGSAGKEEAAESEADKESEESGAAAVAAPPPPPPPPPAQAVRETPAPAHAPAAAHTPAKPQKAKAPKEPAEGEAYYGLRAALGVSAFAGHKAIYTETFEGQAIQLGALASASIGFVCAYDYDDFVSFHGELQYTLYTAHGEFTLRTRGADFGELHVAGVELHALELPVLARFNFGTVYGEAGLQFGANAYGIIYADSDLKKPFVNRFAVGPAIGFGMNLDSEMLVGIRWYISALEYAKNSNGHPWALQASVTKFIF